VDDDPKKVDDVNDFGENARQRGAVVAAFILEEEDDAPTTKKTQERRSM